PGRRVPRGGDTGADHHEHAGGGPGHPGPDPREGRGHRYGSAVRSRPVITMSRPARNSATGLLVVVAAPTRRGYRPGGRASTWSTSPPRSPPATALANSTCAKPLANAVTARKAASSAGPGVCGAPNPMFLPRPPVSAPTASRMSTALVASRAPRPLITSPCRGWGGCGGEEVALHLRAVAGQRMVDVEAHRRLRSRRVAIGDGVGDGLVLGRASTHPCTGLVAEPDRQHPSFERRDRLHDGCQERVVRGLRERLVEPLVRLGERGRVIVVGGAGRAFRELPEGPDLQRGGALSCQRRCLPLDRPAALEQHLHVLEVLDQQTAPDLRW